MRVVTTTASVCFGHVGAKKTYTYVILVICIHFLVSLRTYQYGQCPHFPARPQSCRLGRWDPIDAVIHDKEDIYVYSTVNNTVESSLRMQCDCRCNQWEARIG